MDNMKNCRKCLKSLSLRDFYERPNYRGTETKYKMPYCKKCWADKFIEWREKNKERFKKYQREYHRKKYAKTN